MRTLGESRGRQVPGPHPCMGTDGEFCQLNVSSTDTLGRNEKLPAEMAKKKKANKACITGESNNPHAANKVKFEEQNLTARRQWLLRACVLWNQPLASHLVFIFPNPQKNQPQIPQHDHGEAALASFLCQRTHTPLPASSRRDALSSAQELAPFFIEGPAVIPCPAG